MLQNKDKIWSSDEEWIFNQTNIELERTLWSKTVILTTNIGEFILEKYDDDKNVSLRDLEIISIVQYKNNDWIEFIISPWTLTCTLGYVIILLLHIE